MFRVDVGHLYRFVLYDFIQPVKIYAMRPMDMSHRVRPLLTEDLDYRLVILHH